jgi:tetraacyldisaccharide 4'-kinase
VSIGTRVTALVERLWESESASAAVMRGLLTPAERAFSIAVARRNRGYDRSPPSTRALAALSVGNLTVGGTGKTPVAAWCVQQLRSRGAHPSIVMRGYGDDEWRVHSLLNPGVPVIVSPERTDGVLIARTRGADCVVLDDAFQHRRVSRVADLVLVSADRWTDRVRLLPVGPFREPLSSLQRAAVIVVTVKSASTEVVTRTVRAVTAAAPSVPVAVVRLVPGAIRLAVSLPPMETSASARGAGATPSKRTSVPSMTHDATWLRGRDLHAATAIGDPAAFVAQLRALGTEILGVHRYPDHHAFTAEDASKIAFAARGSSGVICTLKDAVKLGVLWPREAPPLWYVSQTVVVERGAEALDRAFARVLAARATTAPTAG